MTLFKPSDFNVLRRVLTPYRILLLALYRCQLFLNHIVNLCHNLVTLYTTARQSFRTGGSMEIWESSLCKQQIGTFSSFLMDCVCIGQFLNWDQKSEATSLFEHTILYAHIYLFIQSIHRPPSPAPPSQDLGEIRINYLICVIWIKGC